MTFLNTEKISNKYKQFKCLWGLEPNRYVTKIPEILKFGDILDIGVGEGRNAFYLAKKGFNVTGIDISREAIEKFLKIAKAEKIQVNGSVDDAVCYKFDKKYDAIISAATLHFIPRNKMKSVVQKIKNYTKKNGINLFIVFTTKDFGYKKFPDFYFFEENELRRIYKDWEIIEYVNYTKKETHDKPHIHHICALMAKKIK